MDSELFEQMIRYKAFDYRDLRQLVNYVFDKILRLCAPVRDPDVKAMLDELNEMMDNAETIPKVLTKYIEYANDSLDIIYDDLGVVLNGLQNENPNLRGDGMDRQSDGGSF
jgi:DNA polymerase III gamma/tau subunit